MMEMKLNMKNTAYYLRRYIEAYGVNPPELALSSDLDIRTIRGLLKDENALLSSLIKVTDFLNINLDYILFGNVTRYDYNFFFSSPSRNLEEFYNRLSLLCNNRKIKKAKLAAILDKPESTIYSLFDKHVNMNIDDFISFCVILDVCPDDIIYGEYKYPSSRAVKEICACQRRELFLPDIVRVDKALEELNSRVEKSLSKSTHPKKQQYIDGLKGSDNITIFMELCKAENISLDYLIYGRPHGRINKTLNRNLPTEFYLQNLSKYLLYTGISDCGVKIRTITNFIQDYKSYLSIRTLAIIASIYKLNMDDILYSNDLLKYSINRIDINY